jgi:hypothetical protein
MKTTMKLLVQSAMIFFGTLMAAGLVALGEPGWQLAPSEHSLVQQIPGLHALNRWVEASPPWASPQPLTGWHE